MNKKTGYHHGNLRRALLDAAETELGIFGLEGFSLRKVAKRAGVSHAAPAHHFKDTQGLLTALAVEGYQRLAKYQTDSQLEAKADPESQMIAAGIGYLAFAQENPALFNLLYSSNRPNVDDESFMQAGATGYVNLVKNVKALTGRNANNDIEAYKDVTALWAIIHGLAGLQTSGKLSTLAGLTDEDREAMLVDILKRVKM